MELYHISNKLTISLILRIEIKNSNKIKLSKEYSILDPCNISNKLTI